MLIKPKPEAINVYFKRDTRYKLAQIYSHCVKEKDSGTKIVSILLKILNLSFL